MKIIQIIIHVLKHFRGSFGASQSQPDQSRAKLGNWFTGKNNLQTINRKDKSHLVFPSSVYLDNFASSASESEVSGSSEGKRTKHKRKARHKTSDEYSISGIDRGVGDGGSISSLGYGIPEPSDENTHQKEEATVNVGSDEKEEFQV